MGGVLQCAAFFVFMDQYSERFGLLLTQRGLRYLQVPCG